MYVSHSQIDPGWVWESDCSGINKPVLCIPVLQSEVKKEIEKRQSIPIFIQFVFHMMVAELRGGSGGRVWRGRGRRGKWNLGRQDRDGGRVEEIRGRGEVLRVTRRYHTDLSISNQLQSGVLGNMEWVGTKIPCNENAIHIQILT